MRWAGSAIGLLLWMAATLARAQGTGELSPPAAAQLLHQVDENKHTQEDLTQSILIAETWRDQQVIREAEVYNRADDALAVLFTNPKPVAGSGYLRLEGNLFAYDPAIGKWERRTERDRLSGTNVRRTDISTAPLSELYLPSDDGQEQLGGARLRKLLLKAKPGVDAPFALMRLWVDEHALVRKTQEFSESGKLLRSTYVIQANSVHSAKLKRDLLLPGQIQMQDEVDHERKTVVVFKSASLGAIPPSVFTKAWMESKSR